MNLHWINYLVQLATRSRKSSVGRRVAFQPLRVERLEDRLAPAVITVDDMGDTIAVDGKVTLREAIESINKGANENADVTADITAGGYGVNDTIKFNIPGAGVKTINLTDILEIKKAVTINAYTQGVAAGNTAAFGNPINATLLIVLKMDPGGDARAGLLITGNDSTVKGLVIQGFEFGIVINGNNNKVQGCFIGTDDVGNTSAGNGIGVLIDEGSNNLIGGPNKADRNLISGNTSFGVEIGEDDSDHNTLQGNYIGTKATGAAALANGHDGVLITGSSQNVIGGPEAEAPNLISGNGHNGVRITGTNASLNQVVHNRIGTNGLGTAEVQNGIHGVFITSGASFNIVGGADGTNTRNLISGNKEDGVRILGSTTLFNQVIGNYIGTDHLGATAVGIRGVCTCRTRQLSSAVLRRRIEM